MLCTSILLFVLVVYTVQQHAHSPEGKNPLHDGTHVADKEHIMEHLDGVVKKPEQMTEQELQFHYFKLHDSDRNNMLDGLELVHAITHFQGGPGHAPPEPLADSMLADIVDNIFKQDDSDHDGFINYIEFAQAQAKRMQMQAAHNVKMAQEHQMKQGNSL